MDSLEQRYQHLTVPELEAHHQQLTDRMWETMDLLHAIEIGRAAVANTLKERLDGTTV